LRPIRGTWLEFEISRSDVISVRVDRRRKFVVTALLRAMGFSQDEQLQELFSASDSDESHHYLESSLAKDTTKSTQEALVEIYKKMRPGEPIVLENAQRLLYDLFFNPRRYDLGRVGRYKLNQRLNVTNRTDRILTKADLTRLVNVSIRFVFRPNKVNPINRFESRDEERILEYPQRLEVAGQKLFLHTF